MDGVRIIEILLQHIGSSGIGVHAGRHFGFLSLAMRTLDEPNIVNVTWTRKFLFVTEDSPETGHNAIDQLLLLIGKLGRNMSCESCQIFARRAALIAVGADPNAVPPIVRTLDPALIKESGKEAFAQLAVQIMKGCYQVFIAK